MAGADFPTGASVVAAALVIVSIAPLQLTQLTLPIAMAGACHFTVLPTGGSVLTSTELKTTFALAVLHLSIYS